MSLILNKMLTIYFRKINYNQNCNNYCKSIERKIRNNWKLRKIYITGVKIWLFVIHDIKHQMRSKRKFENSYLNYIIVEIIDRNRITITFIQKIVKLLFQMFNSFSDVTTKIINFKGGLFSERLE